MGKGILLITVLGLMVWGTGCAGPVFKKFDVSTGESLSIDATQRIILVKYRTGHNPHLVVCAEPSPDVMTAKSLALAASGGNGPINGKLQASLNQAVANIGLRTATIQLLRDGLYRACEGYMNEVLTSSDYRLIVQNFDRLMVALLAIDSARAEISSSGSQNTQSNKNGTGSPASGSQNPGNSSDPKNTSTTNPVQNTDQGLSPYNAVNSKLA